VEQGRWQQEARNDSEGGGRLPFTAGLAEFLFWERVRWKKQGLDGMRE